MLQIIVEPQNPLDLTSDEVRDLAQDIARLEPGYDVRIAGEGFAAPAVTLWEVVFVWLPEAAKNVWPQLEGALLTIFIAWAKERFKKNPAKRPKCVNLVGPDGKVIKSVVVRSPASEPEDITAQYDSREPPRKRPPLS